MQLPFRRRRASHLGVHDDDVFGGSAGAEDARHGQTPQWSLSPVEQPDAWVPRSCLGANVETDPSLSGQQADLSAVNEYEGIERLLLADYCPPLRPEQVRQCLVDGILEFEHDSARTDLPVLIEREARVRLRALRDAHSTARRPETREFTTGT